MANYHLEVKTLSRGRGNSFACRANYISGVSLHDKYLDITYSHRRYDVAWAAILSPVGAPHEFSDLQTICNEIENAERQYDARTGRELIGSLPNELSTSEQIEIVQEFIDKNFIRNGLCAIAAIHKGENLSAPERNNPHTHILVSTRTVGPDGFSKTKDLDQNQKGSLLIWRKQWAEVQNRAYERNGLDIRVSHESLEVQGRRDREATVHLSLSDWQKEKRGIHTPAGDRRRAVAERNARRVREKELAREQSLEMELSR